MNLWNNEWCIKAIAKNKTKNDSQINPRVEFWSFGPGEDFLFPKNASYIQLHNVNFCTFWDFFPTL